MHAGLLGVVLNVEHPSVGGSCSLASRYAYGSRRRSAEAAEEQDEEEDGWADEAHCRRLLIVS